MVSDQLTERRRSSQPVMPALLEHTHDGYDIYPARDIGPGRIVAGHAAIATLIGTSGTIVLDGYPGVGWEQLRAGLSDAWDARGLTSEWLDMADALRSPDEIETLVEPYLGGADPIFGTACTRELRDFFSMDAVRALHPIKGADLTVLYGTGASLSGWPGLLVWVEVPKNELQFRARAGQSTNVGSRPATSAKVAYKRNYFVDWPVLNSHKQGLLASIDVLIDEQRPEQPTAIRGEDLRGALTSLTRSPLRARPWFEPGAWGGQWMKTRIPRLAQDVPNYAWSFELISPENGIVLESDALALEVPFDTLLFHDSFAVLGESAARFGPEFPIRFDFLDTFQGGNLSIQVHPRPDYIRHNFGERFTQDETYYILDCEPGSDVYLGFRDDIDPASFRTALELSASTGKPIEIERFVLKHPAKKHDLFLIPHGTIHGSGVNNLVLEISATPYIFTFKLYDWVRVDLDGHPRPLNIERGLANVFFDRKGARIAEEFISRPRLADSGTCWQLVDLPTHPDHFYDIRRLELEGDSAFELPTNDSVQVMSLVEGNSVLVEAGGVAERYRYAETFVVPAAAERVRFRADGPVKVVIASIKPGRGPQ